MLREADHCGNQYPACAALIAMFQSLARIVYAFLHYQVADIERDLGGRFSFESREPFPLRTVSFPDHLLPSHPTQEGGHAEQSLIPRQNVA
ncbi:MAG: hypothetical protein ACN6OP_22710 [Pseudomonadales bacterium]